MTAYFSVSLISRESSWIGRETCTLGGTSIPLTITVPALPFADVSLTLGVTTYTSGSDNPSENITPDGTVLAFSTTV